MPKKVTAFVSGTAVDLLEERRAIIDVLQSLGICTHSMEQFGARAARPIDTCLAEVRSSDIMILIIGHRYGTLVPGSKPSISFSHAEYLEAIASGVRPLVYIRSDDVEILPTYVEANPRKRRRIVQVETCAQGISYCPGISRCGLARGQHCCRRTHGLTRYQKESPPSTESAKTLCTTPGTNRLRAAARQGREYSLATPHKLASA
jgi:Domain of unknown function (DUF4062)